VSYLSSSTATGHGLWMALPPGWVSLDVDPSTSTATIRRMVELAAEADETVAENREALERMLIGAARDCATDGTDFSRMATELADADGARTISVVDLEAGRAVKRSGHRHTQFPGTEEQLELLTHQFFIPVPDTTNLLAVVAFPSPTLALEDDMVALFDTIAEGFVFT